MPRLTGEFALRTLLIDNYDSYTFNLYQLLAEVSGTEPIVVRNDQCSWEELVELPFDNVVISPGPGTPERAVDFGVCRTLLRRTRTPTLGVCLGHQGLGAAWGGRIEPAAEIMHGRTSRIRHSGAELFAGLPQGFRAVRYHSLALDRRLPASLEPIAWAEDGTVMGIRHRERPLWGVQFHPESVCTEHGARLVANFLALVRRPRRTRLPGAGSGRSVSVVPRRGPARAAPMRLRATVRPAGGSVAPERAFEELFAGAPYAFWLDSGCRGGGSGRFSFLGALGGELSKMVRYRVRTGVEVLGGQRPEANRADSIFDYLAGELARYACPPLDAPFDFAGGFLGYFGYELKADCGSSPAHVSDLPDAQFLFVDRFLAFDHERRAWFLVELVPNDGRPGHDSDWLRSTERALDRLREAPAAAAPDAERPLVAGGFELGRSPDRYLADIAECKRRIAAGDAYEVCLTNQLRGGPCPRPLELYKRLRRLSPAPYSAYLRFDHVAILSSSPERFLHLGRDRQVEARPIKGTAPRGRTASRDAALASRLRRSAKERAENLMIVDLLRNDLGLVCEIGSVRVPRMMEVETYATVHQLVSTVSGRLRAGLDATDCIRAAFPGGSMTGAPKLRVMEIIDELEGEARGIYSGAIGYLSLDGSADLSIVIRTIVATREQTTIGAGGAIVIGSDPQRELDELMLKARAPLRAALGSGGKVLRGRPVDPAEAAGQPPSGQMSESAISSRLPAGSRK